MKASELKKLDLNHLKNILGGTEFKIVQLRARGYKNREIGQKLNLKEYVVRDMSFNADEKIRGKVLLKVMIDAGIYDSFKEKSKPEFGTIVPALESIMTDYIKK